MKINGDYLFIKLLLIPLHNLHGCHNQAASREKVHNGLIRCRTKRLETELK